MKRLFVVVLLVVFSLVGFQSDCLAAERKSAIQKLTISSGDGVYVTPGGSLEPGWYTVSPELGKCCKLTIVDADSFSSPRIVSSFMWWPEGNSLLSSSDNQPEQYTFPLWEGCFLLTSYYGDLEYDRSSGELSWSHFDNSEGMEYGAVTLEYAAPLAELSNPSNDDFQEAVNSANEAAEQYRKSAERHRFVASLDAKKDIIYEMQSGTEWTTGVQIEVGVYRILYLGSGFASLQIQSGNQTETDYVYADYAWSAENKTEYDVFVFPLSKGCKLNCSTSEKDNMDVIWLVKVGSVK